jgi:tRNA threonylcarbamoyl adenosine modification protein (Sua5/YciO/YrdC/YwlC family)
MSELVKIHPDDPQPHLIRRACAIVQKGGIIVYPTDSGYALGCQMGNKAAVDRIRTIRKLDKKHALTLVCRDISELSIYARIDDTIIFRLLKNYTPGAYTFLLKATHEVPKRLMEPKRKIIGIRIPDHRIALAIVEALGEPLLSSTLILPDQTMPLLEPTTIQEIVGRRVDLVVHGGFCGLEPTTVIDLVEDVPHIVRYGKGDPRPFL